MFPPPRVFFRASNSEAATSPPMMSKSMLRGYSSRPCWTLDTAFPSRSRPTAIFLFSSRRGFLLGRFLMSRRHSLSRIVSMPRARYPLADADIDSFTAPLTCGQEGCSKLCPPFLRLVPRFLYLGATVFDSSRRLIFELCAPSCFLFAMESFVESVFGLSVSLFLPVLSPLRCLLQSHSCWQLARLPACGPRLKHSPLFFVAGALSLFVPAFLPHSAFRYLEFLLFGRHFRPFPVAAISGEIMDRNALGSVPIFIPPFSPSGLFIRASFHGRTPRGINNGCNPPFPTLC